MMNRRHFMLGGALALAGHRLLSATPSCTLAAEQEEGPYYIDANLLRANLTEGKPGLPVQLRILILDANKCVPMEKAAVDIWHCDAGGVYSGFTSNGGGRGGGPGGPGFGSPPGAPPGGRGGRGGPPASRVTDEQRFLRGIQLTDGQGIAVFQTVYPGWYAGRTIHVHLKVHTGGAIAGDKYNGGHVSHTGQIFLPEEITADVARTKPYLDHANVHRTLQSEDGVFRNQNGARSIAALERVTKGTNDGGFVASIAMAVNPDAFE